MLSLVIACVLSADPLPDLLPALVPPVQTIEVLVTAEVRKEPVKKLTKKVKQIVGWRPGACPTCPATPIYGEVEVPMTADEIKVNVVLDKFQANTLTKDEVDDLKSTVPSDTIKAIMHQRWSTGSCGMACRSGGSLLYNVYGDGTEEVAPEQPDSAPEEGVHGGDRGGGFRFFRGRR